MKIPSSTYRIQFNKDFTFRQLKAIIPYLHQLGVSTIYASPIFKATPGSTHGYDVIDPHVINPEIGTESELAEISAMLEGYNMTWLQDIVPNHMAFDPRNLLLMDVLERGQHSRYYHFFDIDWDHHDPQLHGRVMVPFLGKPLDECVSSRELSLELSHEGFTVAYFDTRYPVSIGIYSMLRDYLRSRYLPKQLEDRVGKLAEVAKEEPSPEQWVSTRRAFFAECAADPECWNAITAWTASLNADPIKFRKLLDNQFYVLVHWRETEHKLNYRRFFTVNSLICVAMESESVFDEYHTYIHSLYKRKLIHGLRIDHIDGLKDPSQYIKRLRSRFGKDCYVIAEKILESSEDIPGHWSLEGTSGYEFLSCVNQLFTDRQGASDLVNYYRKLVPELPAYDDLVLKNKRLILDEHMGGELENLSYRFVNLSLQGDLSYEQIEHALSALMLSWPVYRIYPEALPLTGTNLELLEEAFARAYRIRPELTVELNYLHDLFTLKDRNDPRAEDVLRFLKRMMQFTGPLTAKGVEDTTFYIYNPLISHVEVGDAPSTLGISVRSFHKKMLKRQAGNPQSLNATATHDTKRGEDARVRLNLLSEIPQKWIEHVERWRIANSEIVSSVDGQRAPSVNDEYFIYQSMLGGFPEDSVISESWIGRLQEYIVKVVREAKVQSNWNDPNVGYEEACKTFIQKALQANPVFSDDFVKFATELRRDAELYSISQLLVKAAAPGIPDIYQGTELFDLSYVDPDNRRPVDYALRQRILEEIQQVEKHGMPELMNWLKANTDVGARKLFTTGRLLNFRKEYATLFERGNYVPIDTPGAILGFARNFETEWLIVIIPLGMMRKQHGDGALPDVSITLPATFPRRWRNIFTNEIVDAEQSFSIGRMTEYFPVIALYNES